MASKRSCICCGDKYSYCPSCGSDRLKPTWYSLFCSETCKELWETVSRFSMGFIDKNSAAEIVQALPLKDKSKYAEAVQAGIEKLLVKKTKPELKPRRMKKMESEIPSPVADNTKVEENAPLEKPIPMEEITPVVEETHEVVESKEE